MKTITRILAAGLLTITSTAYSLQAAAPAGPGDPAPNAEVGEPDPHADAAGVPEVGYDAIAANLDTSMVTADVLRQSRRRW